MLRTHFGDRCTVGSGTAITLERCKAALDAGAQFLLTPGTPLDVFSYCAENDLGIIRSGVLHGRRGGAFRADGGIRSFRRFGLNSLICFSRRSILFPAASAVTSRSPFVLTISNVCVPIDPVDPKIAIFFIVTFYLYSAFMLQSTKLWISNASITHISPFTETGKDRK